MKYYDLEFFWSKAAFNENNGTIITVDSLLILLLGFPSASIISRAYNNLWALLILRSSFQLSPSLLLNYKKKNGLSRQFPKIILQVPKLRTEY